MANQDESTAAALRRLPSVDSLLQDATLENCAAEVGREVVVDAIRRAIDQLRAAIVSGTDAELDETAVRQRIVAGAKESVEAVVAPYYKRVINATGIILHTGLGRAVLPARALRQIQEELTGYSLLQSDTATGKRSKRDEAVEQLLKQLTGAEAATLVNNNAAATSIVLNTIANGKEVL
ncbi:MAG: hypothetical protein ACYTDV_14250 [Planctomycetota bacterium]|jgi:L-seryl-tRNA(Ser) seleniumtransferase